MTEHTPGPWTDYPMPTKTMREARANKQLAIAAPALLKALLTIRHMWAGHAEECEYVVSRYKGKCDCDWPKIAAMSDEAINIATKSET